MTQFAHPVGDSRPTPATMLDILERMLVIRRVEEQLGVDSKSGKQCANVHSYIGQEAVAAGVCARLEPADFITSTHRGHGHFLAKGATPRELIAEVHVRRTGACRGIGGSMHVTDLSKAMLGANGIVGGGIPIAAGAALVAQNEDRGRVAVSFFGDGAAAQGVLSEVLNIAALWKLPLVLVCESNMYAELMPIATVTAGAIADRAHPFGVPGATVDGNDALAVWVAAGAAIARARSGEGPTLLEAMTYRTRGHIEAEVSFLPHKYRSDEEIASWVARDPIDALVNTLAASGTLTMAGFKRPDAEVAAMVAEAVRFADASESPDPAMIESIGFARVAG
jgi:pyruvate dehydrogenase E1 component alpha subunit